MIDIVIELFIAVGRVLCKIGLPRQFIWKIIHKILKKLISTRIKAYQNIDGWLSNDEASGLYLLSCLLDQNCKVIEIGSWKGKSTFCLAKGLPKGGTLIAIDPFDGSGELESAAIYQEKQGDIPLFYQFVDNMTKLGVMEKIKPLKGYSHQFINQFSDINLLFIDGDHSIEGCDSDFLNYSPYIVQGGYLVFHDFDTSRKDLGPTWVIENRVLPSREYEFWGVFDSLWVARKR